jgi:hypothetical protein
MKKLSATANRINHAEGIGYSSHKNQYTRGTLENNWYEERAVRDDKFNFAPAPQTNYTSTLQASFPARPVEARRPAEHKMGMETKAVPGAVLFGHGSDFERRELTSTVQRAFSPTSHNSNSNNSNGSLSRTALMEKKSAQWAQEKAERRSGVPKPVLHADFDASHSIVAVKGDRSLVTAAAPQTMRPKRGEFTRAVEADWLNMGLRS